ncbi:Cob(I)yrinic acid a,c-diamide adenosyltransferase [Gimesia maris]|uniref:ATP:cob(I)alamin adenosyltransferase n=1 Tax=Gimesia maris TaxID=122 RepID=UPI00118799C1|nr:ATP:cob(I)alamin adenosyltransferase [Gimesia maris]QDU15285.1 Cob(I)yrinic acid a,c-diamide adenosyltransferase [Gimesia maris]
MAERGTVHLNMIVTKTGDQGQTCLNDGSRISKASPRIKALASIEQVAVKLGYFIQVCEDQILQVKLPENRSCEIKLTQLATSFQQEMYDIGSDISTPFVDGEDRIRFPQESVEELTELIGRLTLALEPLDSFILPQGSLRVLIAHDIRTLVRQAEIHVWEIEEAVNPAVPQFLNRLSDFWFVLGRILFAEETQTGGTENQKWEPRQKQDRGCRFTQT